MAPRSSSAFPFLMADSGGVVVPGAGDARLQAAGAPAQRVQLVWDDLRYAVRTPAGKKEILRGCDGFAEPGYVVCSRAGGGRHGGVCAGRVW